MCPADNALVDLAPITQVNTPPHCLLVLNVEMTMQTGPVSSFKTTLPNLDWPLTD